MTSRSTGQRLFDAAIPFLGVGAGAATVVLVHNPKALLPRPPYWPWLFIVSALAAFAMVLAMGLADGWEEDDAVVRAERWKAAVIAYLVTVLASIEFIVLTRVLR